jgi:hypothetical protein
VVLHRAAQSAGDAQANDSGWHGVGRVVAGTRPLHTLDWHDLPQGRKPRRLACDSLMLAQVIPLCPDHVLACVGARGEYGSTSASTGAASPALASTGEVFAHGRKQHQW